MAPPLDISFKTDDNSNSVYNHLNQWKNLVEKEKELATVDTSQNQTELNLNNDLDYFRNKLFEASCIPKRYFDTHEMNENALTRKVLFEKYKKTYTIAEKWANSGILDGLTYTRNQNISLLLESQARQLINEPMTVGISSRGFGEIVPKPKIKESFFLIIKSFFISIWRKYLRKKLTLDLIL